MLSQCGKSDGFKLLRLRKTLSRPPALNRTIYPGYDGRDNRKSCPLFLLAALLFSSFHHAMLLDDFEQIPWQDREGLDCFCFPPFQTVVFSLRHLHPGNWTKPAPGNIDPGKPAAEVSQT